MLVLLSALSQFISEPSPRGKEETVPVMIASQTWKLGQGSDVTWVLGPEPVSAGDAGGAGAPSAHRLCALGETGGHRRARGGGVRGAGGQAQAVRTHLVAMMRTATPMGPEYTP